jgi:hypothetical protein
MIRRLLLLVIVLSIYSCKETKQSNNIPDYLGQELPGLIPEVFAPGIVSLENRLEHGLSFNYNSKEVIFGTLTENDLNGNIHYAHKVNDVWTKPEIFSPLKNKCAYLPYFTPDGQSILFAQADIDTINYKTNIWIISKTDKGWDNSLPIQTNINSKSREANATMTYDGTLYFSSNRNCEGKDDCFTADLFYSKSKNKSYHSIESVSEVNSTNDEESIFISPEEDYLLLCRYTDDDTGVDLYISYKDINNKWSKPEIIDSTINSKYWDRRPFVSHDNKYLFYTQLQLGDSTIKESDIFWVSTAKVFKPYIYNPIKNLKVKKNQNFEVSIPEDYFRDIDHNQLDLKISQLENSSLKYNQKTHSLSGYITQTGSYEMILSATDPYDNVTHDKIKLVVSK